MLQHAFFIKHIVICDVIYTCICVQVMIFMFQISLSVFNTQETFNVCSLLVALGL